MYQVQRHLGTPVAFSLDAGGVTNKSTEIRPCSSLPLRLCNGSFYCKVEQFHLCLGWGGGLTVIAIRGSCLCLKKAEEKGTLVDWHTVAGELCNSNKREATTQEMMLYKRLSSHIHTTHRAAKWKTGYSYGDRRRDAGGEGLCWMFGVKVLGLNVEVCEKTDRQR